MDRYITNRNLRKIFDFEPGLPPVRVLWRYEGKNKPQNGLNLAQEILSQQICRHWSLTILKNCQPVQFEQNLGLLLVKIAKMARFEPILGPNATYITSDPMYRGSKVP